MAQVRLIPGRTEIQLDARGRANRIPPELLEVPGGLYPLKSAAFEVDEYRIMAGWPVPVPEGDIRIECLVSAEGEVLSDREEPTALVTGADLRWVADEHYYDQIACRWAPIQGHVTPWETTPDHAPTLVTDYEYRLGDERFVGMTALNFDSDTADYLWNDLSLAMGGVEGYTLVMVLSPNSIYGNNAEVVENALWGPASTEGSWAMFTVSEQAIWLRTEELPAQRGVAIGTELGSTAPAYLAMVVGRPQTTLYAASGPSSVRVRSLPSGEAARSLSTRFWLGNGPFPEVGTMDMALLDLGIYGNPLTKSEVVAEITALSQIYGGDR